MPLGNWQSMLKALYIKKKTINLLGVIRISYTKRKKSCNIQLTEYSKLSFLM